LAKRDLHTPTRGRHSPPVDVILRLRVVKRLSDWSDEQTERFVGDSLVRRPFGRVSLAAIPDDTTLSRWANLLGPQTLEQLNDRVGERARARKVTRGRKPRVESTVVETTIHYPTDSRLRGDGVRVLSRLFRRAEAVIGEGVPLGKEVFRSRTRSVRRLAQQRPRVARRRVKRRPRSGKEPTASGSGLPRRVGPKPSRGATSCRRRPTHRPGAWWRA
jgi:IS5 family transposase